MSGTALVIAAHGAGDGSPANLSALRLAREAGARGGFDEAAAAFRRGTPGFAGVLDGLSAARVVVVPLFTSPGFFSKVVLPRGLERNRRSPEIDLRVAPCAGLHPAVPGMVLDLAIAAAGRERIRPGEAALVLVGHGTERHPGSRAGAGAAAREIRGRGIFASVEEAYLDDEPSIEDAIAAAPEADLVLAPFLLGSGRHAGEDIARRAAAARSACRFRAVLAEPLGAHPALGDLVLDLALGARRPTCRPALSGSRSRPGGTSPWARPVRRPRGARSSAARIACRPQGAPPALGGETAKIPGRQGSREDPSAQVRPRNQIPPGQAAEG